jgi:cobalt-zinc-cadmium efflux system outer membrane protein
MKHVLGIAALMSLGVALAEPRPTQDWTLNDVLQRVTEANRDVQSAQRSVEAALADQVSAGVTPATQFSLLSQAIDAQHLGSGSLWQRPIDTIARLDKTLERGGKADWRLRTAQAGAQAAREDLADALRTRRLGAAQAYWDLKLAQEQLQVSERNAQVAQASRDAAQERLRQGDLSRLEANRLAVEAARADNEVATARHLLNEASRALAQWLSLDHAGALHAGDSWPSPGEPASEQDDATWLNGRPDVQAAAARLEQAQSALSLAQAQRSADVTVSLQFEHNPGVGQRLWGVGVAFPLGIEDRQQGPAARALVAVNEAQAQLDKVRAAALADRASQRDALGTALARLHRLETQLLPQAREALRAAEYAREQGALPLQDVLDARRALHAAELDAASAHADAAKAWSALTMTSDLKTVTP